MAALGTFNRFIMASASHWLRHPWSSYFDGLGRGWAREFVAASYMQYRHCCAVWSWQLLRG